MNAVDISIVIPTHNRADRFRSTLDALARQTFPTDRFEVIVVADGCQDHTASLVGAYPAPFRLRLLEQPGSGAANARNQGAAQAEGRLLLFLDDDIEASPGLVAAHVAAHVEGTGQNVVIGYLPTILYDQKGLFRASLRRFWEDTFNRMGEPGYRFAHSDLLSGNFSIAAAHFSLLGGFNPTLRCREDYEFGIRVIKSGAPLCFARDAQGYHHEATTLDRTLRRKEQEGKADVQLGRLNPEIIPVLPVMRFWNFCVPAGPSLSQKTFSIANRAVRDTAFRWPHIGDALAAGGRKLLDLLEACRIRYRWRLVLDALMVYWYWRGVAQELPTIGDTATFLHNTPQGGTVAPPIPLDLQKGVAAAAERLDQERPASVHLTFGPHWIGVLPSRPGVEGLRGVHLRKALADDLAHPFLSALAVEASISGEGLLVGTSTRGTNNE